MKKHGRKIMDQAATEQLCRILLEQDRDYFLESGTSPHALVGMPLGQTTPVIVDLEVFPQAAWSAVRETMEECFRLEWIAHVSAAWMKRVTSEEASAMRERGEGFKPPREYPDASHVFLCEVKAGACYAVMSQSCERNSEGGWVVGELLNMSHADAHYSRVLGVGERPECGP